MSTQLREGEVFAGRYRVVTRIASGGMGSVYEVIHLETNRRRALKLMHPHILQSADMRERFLREARVTAEIDSEFIVDVFDAGIDEPTGMPFLVMELLRGEEIGKRLKRLGRLPVAEVLTYLGQVAVALDKTHAASIVHRDLKPENLFLTARDDGSPRIKILDFGVAKLIAEGTTQAGVTNSVGTPLYMAPEQFKADSTVSPASDIYALGMIAYALLVGQPYWVEEARRGANVFAFAIVAMSGPPEPPSLRALRWGARLPPGFDAWFATATAVDPAQRFPTATVAVGALGPALGAAEAAPPPSPPLLTIVIPKDAAAPPSGPALAAGQTEILLSSGDFVTSGATTTTTVAATVALKPASPLHARTVVFAVVGGMALGAVALVALWPAAHPAVAPAATGSAPAPPPSAPPLVVASPSAVAPPSAEPTSAAPLATASAAPVAPPPAPASALPEASASPRARPRPPPPVPAAKAKPPAPSRYSQD
jgi:serine/threonine-protein kinase